MTDSTLPSPGSTPAAGRLDAAPPVSAVDFRAIFDRIADGVVVLAPDWRYVYLNRSGAALLGHTPESLVGRRYRDIFPEGVGLPFYRAYERAFETQQPVVFEDHYAPWDRWFENRVYPSDAGLVILFTDVTERRRAEHALERSEQRLRSLVEASAQVVWWTGPNGEPANDLSSWRAFTGISVEKAQRSEWADLIHPDDRARAVDAWRDALERGSPFEIENRVRRRDGEWRHMVTRAVPVRNTDGTVREWVGAQADVTEQVQATAALRAAERRLHRMVDSLPAGVVCVQGDRLTENPAVERLTGYPRDELSTLDAWFAALHGPRAAEARAGYDADRAAGFPYPRTVVVTMRDGERRTLEFSASAADDLDVWVLHDVTARELAEVTLRERGLQLAEAQRIAALGSWTWDLVADRAAWTPEMYRIYDVDPRAGPRKGTDFLALVHPDDREHVAERVRDAIERRVRQVESEFRVVRPSGQVRRVVSRAEVTYGTNGTPVMMAGTNQDVTDRRHLEEQFLQAQKMEAVGQLAGGIAHDFNNLLTAIGANADLSLHAIGECDRARPAVALLESVAADLREIRRATNRAADLTRQLLAFSRRQVLDPRPVDLNEVVTQAMPLIRRLVSANITIDTVLANGLGTVVVDPRQIEQVLMNLVVNARDALSGVTAPRVTVATLDVCVMSDDGWGRAIGELDPRVTLLPRGAVPARPGLEPGLYALLLVQDSGVGMDAETQARVFEPFFTTKGVGRGTGLGLATVYGIVKQSGGYVYVDSMPGEGTLCSVYLPCTPREPFDPAAGEGSRGNPAVAATASGADAATPMLVGGETILLVEDEVAVRALLKRLLTRAGHRVLEARHGAEALALWDVHRDEVSLVLTDVVMPELGGIALVERLRAERPELPVLFISGHSETGAPAQALLGPRTEWLTKPFDIAMLLQTVAELLGGRLPRS